MALETGDYFGDLTITNPTATDPKSAGDDHIRLGKKTAKQTFPGFAGAVLVRATETGSATAHVLTPATALVSYVVGTMLLYSPTNTNSSGAVTVNVSALGAKSIKTIMGADPTANSITANQPILLVYDGTNFVAIGGSMYLAKTGNQTFTGDLTLTGNQTVSGTFAVTGASTFTGDIGGTGGDKKADKAGSTYTGTHDFSGATSVLVPTPTLAAQAVTKAYADGLAMSAALPSQTGNAGKAVITDGATASWGTLAALGGGTGQSSYTIGDILYASGATTLTKLTAGTSGYVLTSGGAATAPSWAASGIKQITASATSITLTSTSTLAVMTPTTYGVSVTLQDATSDTPRDAYHAIDNKGAYPVRVLDSTGALKGMVMPRTKSIVGLQTASAAGVWCFSSLSPLGGSAQLFTTNMAIIDACIDIGSSQEVIIGRGVSSANCYGVVYNRSTNTFGSVTLIRTATFGTNLVCACLSGTNQVLVCSVPTGAATFEAVALSISGTTITVNTAATATLSANITGFAGNMADGLGTGNGFGGVVAVTGGFVVSYLVATPAAQIRGLIISGTTVTLSAATVLDGTAGGLLMASGAIAIAASTATTHLYTKPYTLSAGPTLTAGTGTDTNSGTMTLNKMAALGTRWYVGYNDGGTTVKGGVISLSGTTTTISVATLFSAGALQDAIIVGTTKVMVTNNQSSNNCNILTDSAGTASAGTAITANAGTSKGIIYLNGTNVLIGGASTAYSSYIDCSGASPVMLYSMPQTINAPQRWYSPSDATLQTYPSGVRSTTGFAQSTQETSGVVASIRWDSGIGKYVSMDANAISGATTSQVAYRGRVASEIWMADGATVITKMECIA